MSHPALQGTPQKGVPLFPANPAVDKEHVWLGGPSGSAYRTKPQTRRMKEWCLKRDGLRCMYCRLQVVHPGELTVHHVDHKIYNSYSDNIQLYHPDCNWDERWGKPPRRLQPTTLVSLAPAPTKEPAEHVGLLPASLEKLEDDRTTPSHLTNLENEVEFRRAAFEAVKRSYDPTFKDPEKYMNAKQLMYYCMEKSGSSKDASYGYRARLLAPQIGPLMEELELGGKIKTVKFRHPKDVELSLEDLLKKYPKEGQVYAH